MQLLQPDSAQTLLTALSFSQRWQRIICKAVPSPEPAKTQREGRPGTGRPLSSRIGSKLGPSLMIHLAFFHRFVLLLGLLLHLLELGLLFGCEHTVDLLV
jgi:hypothetical protein